MNDGEIVELDLKNSNEFYKNSKERIKQIKDKTIVQTKPNAPYKYFYEQEMSEQPETLLKAMNYGARLSYHFSEGFSEKVLIFKIYKQIALNWEVLSLM